MTKVMGYHCCQAVELSRVAASLYLLLGLCTFMEQWPRWGDPQDVTLWVASGKQPALELRPAVQTLGGLGRDPFPVQLSEQTRRRDRTDCSLLRHLRGEAPG